MLKLRKIALSKRQVVLMGALVLGLAILAADRLLPQQAGAPGPQRAAASPPASHSPSHPVPPPAVGTRPVETDLPSKLQELARARNLDPTRTTDAFSVPKRWLPEEGSEGGSPPRPSAIEQFIEAHKLTAVVVNEGNSTAQVDGICLSIGDALGRFRLAAVSEKTAVFESAGGKAVLKLQKGK